jgi:selenide,water dikinase
MLSDILGQVQAQQGDPNLLVGYRTRDDAAVYRIGPDQAVISTTDFFMPIVDDPVDFGAIAAVNAISDVYAMGGRPVMAISILGWPVGKLDPEIAGLVVEGARQSCARAGIVLAGGHSIDAPEPIFGLAVTGLVHPDRVLSNDRARSGNDLYLTKPLGVGILTTAEKRGILESGDRFTARDLMLELNDIGSDLGGVDAVSALTDVTGFGLLGHLIELCEGSGLAADIEFASVPKIDGLGRYIEQKCVPGGTDRNFASYGHKVSDLSPEQKAVLCDPQTSGGLLIAVDPARRTAFLEVTRGRNLDVSPLGALRAAQTGSPVVTVR